MNLIIFRRSSAAAATDDLCCAYANLGHQLNHIQLTTLYFIRFFLLLINIKFYYSCYQHTIAWRDSDSGDAWVHLQPLQLQPLTLLA